MTVSYLIKGGKGSDIFHGTVDEDRCSQFGNEGAIKLTVNKHVSRKIKRIDVKHHLVRKCV